MGWIRKVLGELLWPTLMSGAWPLVLLLEATASVGASAMAQQRVQCSLGVHTRPGKEFGLLGWHLPGLWLYQKKTDCCQVKIHICRDFPYAHCSTCITCCNVTFLFGKVLWCHAGGDLAPWNF